MYIKTRKTKKNKILSAQTNPNLCVQEINVREVPGWGLFCDGHTIKRSYSSDATLPSPRFSQQMKVLQYFVLYSILNEFTGKIKKVD